MSTQPTPPTSQPSVTVLPGHVSPWWRNQVFAATVGAWLLTYLNGRLHLGLPADATVALGVGLAILWAIHTIVLDLQALKGLNRPADISPAMWGRLAPIVDLLATQFARLIDQQMQQQATKAAGGTGSDTSSPTP